MNPPTTNRALHEIDHGKKLSENNPETVWGWGTPAGQIRARRRAELITAATQLRPGMRVLEIGCGTGLFTRIFAESGADIVALDISDELLELARRSNKAPNIEWICLPFEQLSSDQPFDAIIGSSVLHHLEIQSALQEIFRLLKPQGIMCFAEPNMLNPQIAIQKNIPWIKEKMGDSPDETAFFRWELARKMRQVGFIDIRITPLDWLHPATPPGLIKIVKLIGTWLENIPVFKEISGSLYISGKRPS